MKTTILIRIQTQIAGTWKKFLAGGYLLFTALCLCMAITYCFGANQGKIIFDLEGTPPFKHVPADVFPVFMTVSIILIILVAWIHAIVIKKKIWDSPATRFCPCVAFATWLAISIFSWLPLLFIIFLWIIIESDIKNEKKRLTKE